MIQLRHPSSFLPPEKNLPDRLSRGNTSGDIAPAKEHNYIFILKKTPSPSPLEKGKTKGVV
jgi:hypothetical protein